MCKWSEHLTLISSLSPYHLPQRGSHHYFHFADKEIDTTQPVVATSQRLRRAWDYGPTRASHCVRSVRCRVTWTLLSRGGPGEQGDEGCRQTGHSRRISAQGWSGEEEEGKALVAGGRWRRAGGGEGLERATSPAGTVCDFEAGKKHSEVVEAGNSATRRAVSEDPLTAVWGRTGAGSVERGSQGPTGGGCRYAWEDPGGARGDDGQWSPRPRHVTERLVCRTCVGMLDGDASWPRFPWWNLCCRGCRLQRWEPCRSGRLGEKACRSASLLTSANGLCWRQDDSSTSLID